MSPAARLVVTCIVAAWISDKATAQFTDAGTSATGKILVRVGAAGVVGFIASKVGK